MNPRLPFECRPPATPLLCRFHQILADGSRSEPLLSLLAHSLSTPHSLTSLESADPKNAPITPLQSADPKIQHLKPFRIRTYKIRRGEGGILLTSLDPFPHPRSFKKSAHTTSSHRPPQVAVLHPRCDNPNLALILGLAARVNGGPSSAVQTELRPRATVFLGATNGNARWLD
jgi:hypothetical protein